MNTATGFSIHNKLDREMAFAHFKSLQTQDRDILNMSHKSLRDSLKQYSRMAIAPIVLCGLFAIIFLVSFVGGPIGGLFGACYLIPGIAVGLWGEAARKKYAANIIALDDGYAMFLEKNP